MGRFLGVRNKQIGRTAKRFLADLFVQQSESFPINPEKRHVFRIFKISQTTVKY